MIDPARRAKLLRELDQEFIPNYDALNMPSATSEPLTRSNTSPFGSEKSKKA